MFAAPPPPVLYVLLLDSGICLFDLKTLLVLERIPGKGQELLSFQQTRRYTPVSQHR